MNIVQFKFFFLTNREKATMSFSLCSSVATSVLVGCVVSRSLSLRIHTDVDKYKIMLFLKNEYTPYTIVHHSLGDLAVSIHAHRLRFQLLSKDVPSRSGRKARRRGLAQKPTVT